VILIEAEALGWAISQKSSRSWTTMGYETEPRNHWMTIVPAETAADCLTAATNRRLNKKLHMYIYP